MIWRPVLTARGGGQALSQEATAGFLLDPRTCHLSVRTPQLMPSICWSLHLPRPQHVQQEALMAEDPVAVETGPLSSHQKPRLGGPRNTPRSNPP